MHGNAVDRSPTDNDSPLTDNQIAYTVRNAAKVLDVGERTMWQLVMDDEIPSIKIGRSRRILRADLMAYAESLRQSA